MAFNKISVDENAKKYWKLLYDTYGEQLTRDIKRRISASLFEHKKVASIDESAQLLPLAHAKDGEGVCLEGMYRDKTAKLMFKATLDKDGEVKELISFDIR